MPSYPGPSEHQALGFQGPKNIQNQFQATLLNRLVWSTLKGNICQYRFVRIVTDYLSWVYTPGPHLMLFLGLGKIRIK